MQTILVADDHEIVRAAVRQIISDRPEFEIVAEADNGLSAIASVRQKKPDLLILDVAMPHANALEVTIEVKRWSPETKILVFTGIRNGSLMQDLIEAGVSALVLKSDDLSNLVEAIDAVSSGKDFISAGLKEPLDTARQVGSLTSREKQILRFIAEGNNNNDVARILDISPKTAENHRSNLMKKLSLHSVSEVMAFAYREGLINSEIN